MSAIQRYALTARAILWCCRCHSEWWSRTYVPSVVKDEEACAPAFEEGWRVYASKRNQRAYCPNCSPTVPMFQVHPKAGE